MIETLALGLSGGIIGACLGNIFGLKRFWTGMIAVLVAIILHFSLS